MKFIYPTSFKSLISAGILFISLFIQVKAQDTMRYLFGNAHIHNIGIYIAPQAEAIQVDGDWRSAATASVGLRLNNRFGIGASCQRLIGDAGTFKSISPLTARMNSMAFRMEYILMPYKMIHINIPLLIGGSRISADSNNNFNRYAFHEGRNNRGFHQDSLSAHNLFIQPGAELEINLCRFAKFFAGAQYRLIIAQYGDAAIQKSFSNGLNINAGIRAGIFNIRMHGHHRHFGFRKERHDRE
ncbi:MAG: hypothetical protein U0V49_10905 [Saprospiraceae bacterium]